MTQHITQEKAVELCCQAEIDAEKELGCKGEYHPDLWKVEARLLCNAAIEWDRAHRGEAVNAKLVKALKGISKAKYQEWDEPFNSAEEFHAWAKSVARAALAAAKEQS